MTMHSIFTAVTTMFTKMSHYYFKIGTHCIIVLKSTNLGVNYIGNNEIFLGVDITGECQNMMHLF